jgi:peptidoglycan hydrolase-like protein with peptidoglycan-binding domain
MSTMTKAFAALTAVALLGGVTGCSAYAAEPRRSGQAAGNAAPSPTPTPSGTTTASPTPEPTTAPPSPTATPTTPTAKPSPPAVLERGDRGDKVRELQFRLRKAGSYSGPVTGFYGPLTERAVARFQRRHGLNDSGEVDAATLRKLRALTPKPTTADLHPAPPADQKAAPVDQRCRVGRVLCISKNKRRLYWVVDGEVQMSLSVRFGSQFTPTRNGVFSVYFKSRNHVSKLYGSKMPYAMFFSGGQAVHYSSDFAARGYSGASHGCVNTRNKSVTRALFDQVRIGDKVVVYRG